jgi:hypothetical protein
MDFQEKIDKENEFWVSQGIAFGGFVQFNSYLAVVWASFV